MKKIALLLIVVFLFGCASIAVHPRGTVLEKFTRGMYAERYSQLLIDGEWTQVPMMHMPTHWVIVQGNGSRLEIPMTEDRWNEVEVGDVILLEGGGGGGPT